MRKRNEVVSASDLKSHFYFRSIPADSVSGGVFDAVDYEEVTGTFCRDEFQSKLIGKRAENGWPGSEIGRG